MLSSYFFRLYRLRNRFTRNSIRRLVCRLEGDEFYSGTLRRIFREYHAVEIGMYSHGGCFIPDAFDSHTTIGRYCSVAFGVRTMNINHPMGFKSTHAFFFNPYFKYCGKGVEEYIPLSIGNDVWLGTNCLILPNVRRIGDGAVVAAGAVVNKDVPPYAVMVGNPARVVRFRFPKEIIEDLLESRWWDKSIGELRLSEFCRPYHPGSTLLEQGQE